MKKIDKPLYENLGAQLKEARLKKGYSLQDVADIIGKSKVTIKRYEDAISRIDMDTLDALCKVLNVKMEEVNYSTGDNIINRIVLVPIGEEDTYKPSPYSSVLQQKLYNKLIQLDEDTQRIVLMMLKFEDVDLALEMIKKEGEHR